MKSVLQTLFILLIGSNMCAQSFQQHSLYLTDLYNLNPACAGLDRSLSVNFNYRDQWSGVTEHPRQLYLNAHLPVYLLNGGVGITLQSDNLGALRRTALKLSYNHITKNNLGLFSGGLSLGFNNTSLNGQQLITPDGIYQDGQINHQDPFLSDLSQRGASLNYEIGMFLGTEKLDVGISIANFFLPQPKASGLIVDNREVMKMFFRMPFYLNDLIFQPSLLIKTDFQSVQTELSCMVKNGNVFGGTSIRGYNKNSLDAIVLIVGFRMNSNYTISYSYDVGLSKLRQVSEGSHEININYNLNKLIGIGLLPEIIYNPRNL